jgi:hypothetical protein
MDELEPEVLQHSYNQHCPLCARKWLMSLPLEQRPQYDGKIIYATCQAKDGL